MISKKKKKIKKLKNGFKNIISNMGLVDGSIDLENVWCVVVHRVEAESEPHASQPGGSESGVERTRSPDCGSAGRRERPGAASQRHGEHLPVHVHLHRLPALLQPRAGHPLRPSLSGLLSRRMGVVQPHLPHLSLHVFSLLYLWSPALEIDLFLGRPSNHHHLCDLVTCCCFITKKNTIINDIYYVYKYNRNNIL